MSVSALFESHKIMLKITGMWPKEVKRNPWYSSFKIYVCLSVNIFLSVSQIIGLSKHATPDNASEYVMDECGFCTMMSRQYILMTNREQILKLFDVTKKSEHIQARNEAEAKIIKFWQNCADKIMKIIVFSYAFLLFSYSITPVFSSGKLLPLKLLFKPNSLDSPWYEVAYFADVLLFGIALCNIASSDVFFVTFICEICKELRLIKLLMEHPGEDPSKTLMLVIKRHAVVMDYGNSVCSMLSSAYFTQHCFLYFITCLSIFTALTTENSANFQKMAWLTVLTIWMTFATCFIGEYLAGVSEDIANALIHSDIILYCLKYGKYKHLKMANFMLLRAQKPMRVAVGSFGQLNLQFFSSTMKSVYTFIMVLRTAYS